jgi:hypothetical protein
MHFLQYNSTKDLLYSHQVELPAHGDARDAGSDDNGMKSIRGIHLQKQIRIDIKDDNLLMLICGKYR